MVKIKEEIKESFIDFLKQLLFILIIILLLGMVLECGWTYNKELVEDNEKYKKIIKYEFNRDFENYNEYLLYKIEKRDKK